MNNFLDKAKRSRNPDRLADEFLSVYFKDTPIVFPLNPFQMLKDLGVLFVLKNFKSLEGIYLPATGTDDIPMVGINNNRPIARQRFTAAHELCHHLRDADKHFACALGSRDENEYFADKFAAALLMPIDELYRQAQVRWNPKTKTVSFDDVLEIADYFGVSFESCVFRLAYRLRAIDGDIDKQELKKRIKRYKPDQKRKAKNFNALVLYEGLIDAYSDVLKFTPNEHARLVFQNNYIYNDSRMEGVQTTLEASAEIVADLRLNEQNSRYCTEENEAYLSVAGHYCMYQAIFDQPKNKTCSIWDMLGLHRKLFSYYPCPEFSGTFRQSDTMVLGAKFETTTHSNIIRELQELEEVLKELLSNKDSLTLSAYIEQLTIIHHKLTVIHPFGDGNGRTLRAFYNMLLISSGISPLYIKTEEKEEYVQALNKADLFGSYVDLFECIFKCLLRSNVDLNMYNLS